MSDTNNIMLQRWAHAVSLLQADPQVGNRLRGFVYLARPQAFVGNVLLIAVPNEYTRDTFQSKLKEPFKRALHTAYGPDTSEAFLIDESLSTSPAAQEHMSAGPAPVDMGQPRHAAEAQTQLFSSSLIPAPTEPESPTPSPVVTKTTSNSSAEMEPQIPGLWDPPAAIPDTETSTQPVQYDAEAIDSENTDETVGWESSARLNPNYTFDTFVIGQSNRFAHAAAFAVSESPANAYNPLFIYGDSGLGKTHLLHAIGHYAKHLYPSLRVRYVNSEEFTNDFINSIRDDEGSSFKQIYRNVDMLLIDDIQFLAGKEHTQEEFFHTFNALHNHQKQVVITSDMPPKQLTGFAERMRSRFEWGLITDVQPPELETRIAILRKKAQSESLNVPGDVMEYIASHITANIRELEGALIRVTAFASLNKQPVDIPLAEVVLKDLITDTDAAEITSSQVLATTASYFGVSIDDLRSKSRTRTLTNARQVAMYLLRELTDMSLPRIGQELGGRDHTTVMHAVRKVSAQMPERHITFNQVTELTNKIKQNQRNIG